MSNTNKNNTNDILNMDYPKEWEDIDLLAAMKAKAGVDEGPEGNKHNQEALEQARDKMDLSHKKFQRMKSVLS